MPALYIYKPFHRAFEDDPVTVSAHAKKNNLLYKPRWKVCKRYAKNFKTMARMANHHLPRADKDRKIQDALQACGERTFINERR